MKNQIFKIYCFLLLAFFTSCKSNTNFESKKSNEDTVDIYSSTLNNEEVIPFSSAVPQTDMDIKRQSARLVGHNPVLFFDDNYILDMNGITRTMHPLEKHGILTEILPESKNLYGELKVQKLLKAPDGNGFLAIFRGNYKEKILITLFSTIDGENFEPVYIDQVSPELIWADLPKEMLPEKNNVLAFYAGKEPQFNLPAYYSFFEFPENKEFKYGAFFINKYPRPRQTYLFGSMDGVIWNVIEHKQQIIIDESNWPLYDPFQDRYLAYLRLWDPPQKSSTGWRKVLLSESYEKNGELFWTDKELVFQTNENDPAGADIYNMLVFAYAGKYIGLPNIYNRRMSDVEPDLLETLTVELAFSHDGYKWKRISQGNQFLPKGSGRSWDSGMTGIQDPPAIINNRLLFYYSGENRRHDEGTNIPDYVSEIGSATLRIDGFVSLDAGPEGGTVVTAPLFPQGKYLYLNADASEGEIRVEVLQDGHSVELKKAHAGQETFGLFSMDKCIPITGDSIAHNVKWEHGENFIDNFPKGWNNELLYINRYKQFEERAIVLKIYLQNAKLYSFWFADDLGPFYKNRLMP